MQITTNETYVKRRGALGTAGTLLGFLVLGAGMFISLQQSQRSDQVIVTWVTVVPWITLGIGIILLNVGKYYAMRYASNPRVDRAIGLALKGLDHRHHLYNFVPGLPVEHLLITPNSVLVLEVRPFFGDIINKGSSWSRPLSVGGLLQRFTDGGLGNPTNEAQRDVDAVQNVLRERLGDEVGSSIVVLPIIVFTNPRVKLQTTEPDVPVVLLADLRPALRRMKDTGRLSPDIQRRLVRAFQWGTQTESDSLSSTRSNTWQRTQK